MINVLTMTDDHLVEAYIDHVRRLLTTAAVRWVAPTDQAFMQVRVWTGTVGFTVHTHMNRQDLPSFTVERVATHIMHRVIKDFHPAYSLDNPLAGRDPAEWGDASYKHLVRGRAWALDQDILDRLRKLYKDHASRIQKAITGLPETRRLAEEIHRQCLEKAPAAREHYCQTLIQSMAPSLHHLLLKEDMSKEDILAAMAKLLDSIQTPRPTSSPAVSGPVDSRTRDEQDRDRLMARFRRELEGGTFRPEEWVWGPLPTSDDYVTVGQIADGRMIRLPFRSEDLDFIRAHLSPREERERDLVRLVQGAG